MPNERLRATLLGSEYNERSLADALSLDPKSVQRWITRDVTSALAGEGPVRLLHGDLHPGNVLRAGAGWWRSTRGCAWAWCQALAVVVAVSLLSGSNEADEHHGGQHHHRPRGQQCWPGAVAGDQAAGGDPIRAVMSAIGTVACRTTRRGCPGA